MLRLKHLTRSLGHRNYRLFFTGQAISLIGTWMARIAINWLVYRLTQDPILLGVVNFAGLAPTFFLGPLAGVWVDRARNLRRLIFLTQLAAACQSVGLVLTAWLVDDPHLAVNLLIALSVCQGVINSFDVPARQAFLPRMVPEKGDLANAIAMNSTLFNSARLIGPAIAGVVIGFWGELTCFVIDAVSYVGVLWALIAMSPIEMPDTSASRPKFWDGLRDGFRYAWSFGPIRGLLALVAVLSFVGMPYQVLLPVYAKEILGGGPHTLGLLTASAGLGATVAALVLAGRTTIDGLPRMIFGAGLAFGISLLGFAYSTHLPLSVALLLTTGFGVLMQTASCSTIIQTIVEPAKRGRVMSLYSVAFLGMAPFGSLASGYGAARYGAPATLAATAVVCIVSSTYLARRIGRSLHRGELLNERPPGA